MENKSPLSEEELEILLNLRREKYSDKQKMIKRVRYREEKKTS